MAQGFKVEEILRRIRVDEGAEDATRSMTPASRARTMPAVRVRATPRPGSSAWSSWTKSPVGPRTTSWPAAAASSASAGSAMPAPSIPTPPASLLVGLGRFTRMLRFFSATGKTYEAEVVLGAATSTLDSSGEVTGTWDMTGVRLEDVQLAAKTLTGTHRADPSDGVRTQSGRATPARAGSGRHRGGAQGAPVTVDRFDVFAVEDAEPGIFRIEVDCSTGTYVRSLAADLGAALGGGAHLRNLRRTAVGSFGLDGAHLIDELDAQDVLTPAQALRDMTQVEVSAEVATLVTHGLPSTASRSRPAGRALGTRRRRGRAVRVYEGTATDRMVAACVLVASG